MQAEDVYYDEESEDEADIVEWYAARPLTVSTVVAVGSIVGAFALGLLAAMGALALMGRTSE